MGHVLHPDMPPDHPSNVVVEGYNQWPGEVVPLFKVRESSGVRRLGPAARPTVSFLLFWDILCLILLACFVCLD